MTARFSKNIIGAIMLAALSGCGGGGSESQGGGNIVTVPPTPAPAPTPSPAPTPAPSGPVFSVGIAGPMLGTLMFDVNGNGNFGDSIFRSDGAYVSDIRVYTMPNGNVGPVSRNLNSPGGDATLVANLPLGAAGIDVQTGYFYSQLNAPSGATAVSPATSLLASLDDDVVAGNMGLGLSARQLATFSQTAAMSSSDPAQVALGRRVAAFNLKLLPYAKFDRAILNYSDMLAPIKDQLKIKPVNLNDVKSIYDIFNGSVFFTSYFQSSENRNSAASLLKNYSDAVDIYFTDASKSAAIHHALRLIVMPALENLKRGNILNPATPSPISEANEITKESLLASFAELSDIPAPQIPAGGFWYQSGFISLFPVTDYYSIPRGPISTLSLSTACNAMAGDYNGPACNDSAIGAGVGIDPRFLTLTAVRVPEKFRNKLSAAIGADSRVSVRRLNDATGLVWFEYDVRSSEGLTTTGRAYVRLGWTF